MRYKSARFLAGALCFTLTLALTAACSAVAPVVSLSAEKATAAPTPVLVSSPSASSDIGLSAAPTYTPAPLPTDTAAATSIFSPTTTRTLTSTPTRTRTLSMPAKTATPRRPASKATPWPPAASSTSASSISLDPTLARVLELTNAERARQGLRAFTANSQLMNAAGWFAQDMASRRVGTLSHTDDQGRDAPARILAFGYRWLYFAENIAMGYTSADAVVAGWMGSEGHRENILNPNLTEIGLGHAAGGGHDYWVQDFGRR